MARRRGGGGNRGKKSPLPISPGRAAGRGPPGWRQILPCTTHLDSNPGSPLIARTQDAKIPTVYYSFRLKSWEFFNCANPGWRKILQCTHFDSNPGSHLIARTQDGRKFPQCTTHFDSNPGRHLIARTQDGEISYSVLLVSTQIL